MVLESLGILVYFLHLFHQMYFVPFLHYHHCFFCHETGWHSEDYFVDYAEETDFALVMVEMYVVVAVAGEMAGTGVFVLVVVKLMLEVED